MSTEDKLYAELRALRKEPTRIEACPLLLHFLGSGEPGLFWYRLREYEEQMEDDLDVRVAFATLNGDGDVLARLVRASELVGGVDQRNVRAYSDRGLRKLARYIATGEGLIWVLFDIFLLNGEPGSVYLSYSLRANKKAAMVAPPVIEVNGEEITFERQRIENPIHGSDEHVGGGVKGQYFPAQGFTTEITWTMATPPMLRLHTSTFDKSTAWTTELRINSVKAVLQHLS